MEMTSTMAPVEIFAGENTPLIMLHPRRQKPPVQDAEQMIRLPAERYRPYPPPRAAVIALAIPIDVHVIDTAR